MMKNQDGKMIYSPSDIVRFMESPFASWMERALLENATLAQLKDKPDPLLKVLQQKGFAHEDSFSSQLKQGGHELLEIKRATPKIEAEETLKAIKSGKEIIVQGRLSSGNFAGYADYLRKVEGKSKLGDYHYEVWDTKLAKKLKPYFVIQLCCYAEMLETIQETLPRYVSVVLGNQQKEKLRVSNYFSYYQTLKATFLEQQENFNLDEMPDPADSRGFGEWSDYAKKLLKEKDHLSQIYNIRRSTIKNLNQADIFTINALIKTDKEHIRKVSQPLFERLKAQAQLQTQARVGKPPPFQLLAHNPDKPKGLHLLPPASPHDVFFDLEGNPLADEGLEYLWGITHFNEQGQRTFKHFWAHDSAEEKQALIKFISWVYPRWQADSSLHIYHYGAYEITALRRLMGRYGVCEHEVDNLLRNEVFVDLYAIIRNGILIGEPSYSLKNIEMLYRPARATKIIGGGDSVVAYDAWQEHNDSAILKNILNYNRDDCDSTQELAAWLRAQQTKNKINYVQYKEAEETKEDENEITEFRDELLTKASKEKNETTAHMIETFSWCLEFHRRENKPMWWRFFDRRDASELDLEDDMDCLIGLERTSKPAYKPTEKARTLFAQEYSFNPDQPFRGKAKSFYILGNDKLEISLHDYNPDKGLITFKHKDSLPDRMSVIPDEYIPPKPIPEAVKNVIKSCLKDNFSPSAITDFLCRRPPRIKNHNGGAIIKNEKNLLAEVIQVAVNLDNSILCIQGPPGAGKTYTAIHIIEELLKQGKRIGITSNSHKAINNLLEGVAKKYRGGKFVKIGGNDTLENNISYCPGAGKFGDFCDSLCLGGTAWAFCNEGFANQFDYLFIDEAGQVPIANLIGLSQATKNIILMGDQMQLAQPIQGTHPGESGKSILEYLLEAHATIPPELGVFLPRTYRMHPDVCSLISDVVYEGRLQSTITPERHIEISSKQINKQAGISFIPVAHEGNTQASDEEVAVIKKLADELIGCEYIASSDDKPRVLTWKDILFIAPYNHQVNQLKRALNKEARVGSVDIFQGQEAPVIILSMCASDAAESPRGIDFILSKSRLNVAISRAQCLAIIVGNPELATTPATSLKQISQVNIFNQLMKK